MDFLCHFAHRATLDAAGTRPEAALDPRAGRQPKSRKSQRLHTLIDRIFLFTR